MTRSSVALPLGAERDGVNLNVTSGFILDSAVRGKAAIHNGRLELLQCVWLEAKF